MPYDFTSEKLDGCYTRNFASSRVLQKRARNVEESRLFRAYLRIYAPHLYEKTPFCASSVSQNAPYTYINRVRVRDASSADAVKHICIQSDRQQQRRIIFDYSKQDSKKANYSRRKLSCFGACSICFQMKQQRRAHQQRQQHDSDSDRQQQRRRQRQRKRRVALTPYKRNIHPCISSQTAPHHAERHGCCFSPSNIH